MNDYFRMEFKKTSMSLLLTMGCFSIPASGMAMETFPLNMASVYFQNQTKGTVLSSDGKALAGITVRVKGTKRMTVTDANGSFIINVNKGEVLEFSGKNVEKKEVTVGDEAVISVILEEKTSNIDEVVIIAYGSKKKVNLTGSVASVNLSEIKDIPAANTASILQGRMPGLTVSNFSAQPGNDSPQIRIRGIGSFNAGQEPLIIVDGVQSQMNQIPANDIESISVLKDAASASIYGVRAANGVILVTTKRGKAGKPQVTLRNNIAFQTPTVNPDFLPSYEWAKIKNLWTVADGGNPVYTDEQIMKMKDGTDRDHFANTNWWDVATRTGSIQTTSAEVRGGTESVRYMVSGEYMNQSGIVIGTDAIRKSLRSNLDANVSKKLKLGLNMYGFQKEYSEPALFSAGSPWNYSSSLLYQIRRGTIPTVPVQYSNGEYGMVDGIYGTAGTMINNPVWATKTGFSNTHEFWVEGKVFASYEIIPGLKFTSSFANIRSESGNKRFVPTYNQYDASGKIIYYNINNSLSESHSTFKRFVFENLLNYDKTFGENHALNLLVGSSQQKEESDWMYGYIQNFPNNAIHELGGGTTNPKVNGNSSQVALLSYFGRVGYIFMDKYLFEANLRYDGSSRMPKVHRFGLFPSFSAGYTH